MYFKSHNFGLPIIAFGVYKGSQTTKPRFYEQLQQIALYGMKNEKKEKKRKTVRVFLQSRGWPHGALQTAPPPPSCLLWSRSKRIIIYYSKPMVNKLEKHARIFFNVTIVVMHNWCFTSARNLIPQVIMDLLTFIYFFKVFPKFVIFSSFQKWKKLFKFFFRNSKQRKKNWRMGVHENHIRVSEKHWKKSV